MAGGAAGLAGAVDDAAQEFVARRLYQQALLVEGEAQKPQVRFAALGVGEQNAQPGGLLKGLRPGFLGVLEGREAFARDLDDTAAEAEKARLGTDLVEKVVQGEGGGHGVCLARVGEAILAV